MSGGGGGRWTKIWGSEAGHCNSNKITGRCQGRDKEGERQAGVIVTDRMRESVRCTREAEGEEEEEGCCCEEVSFVYSLGAVRCV